MIRLAVLVLVVAQFYVTSWAQEVYRLGIQIRPSGNEGMLVERVKADGAATRLQRSDNPGIQGALEPGDIIVAIDSTAVRSFAEYELALERAGANAGRVTLSIKNVRTGAVVDWVTTARKEQVVSQPEMAGQFHLGFQGVAAKAGIEIQKLFQDSPLLRLSDDTGQPAEADVGDVITSINGNPVQTLEQYQAEMGRLDNAGTVRLTLKDIRSGREMAWNTQALRGATPGVQVAPRKIHILLCGLTNDDKIGSAITNSLDKLRKTFAGNIDKQYLGTLSSLTGAQCNADTILRSVDKLKAGPNDTVLVYYLGHGAYDNDLAPGDPSGGHFFQIPSGDLPRRELFQRLQAKNARLTALITDTCNVAAVARPKQRMEVRTRTLTIKGFTAMEKLMLFHRGQVDISASSRDQYSWFTAGYGGWFSNSFCSVVATESDWRTLFDNVSKRSSEYFRYRKEMILANPGDTDATARENLSMQADMNAQAFRLDISSDDFGGSPPAGMRAIESDYISEVPLK